MFAHRSIYHLKEADPHAWVIPRLRGRAKAALVAVEFDEYGAGRADRAHAQLFADLLQAADLSDGVPRVPGSRPRLRAGDREHDVAVRTAPRTARRAGAATSPRRKSPPRRLRPGSTERCAGLRAPSGLPILLHRAHRGRRRARAGHAPRRARRPAGATSPTSPPTSSSASRPPISLKTLHRAPAPVLAGRTVSCSPSRPLRMLAWPLRRWLASQKG